MRGGPFFFCPEICYASFTKDRTRIKYPYFIASRYLTARRSAPVEPGEKRSKEKTEGRFVSVIVAIATAGVAVGVAALIVTLSILAGFEKTLTDNVVRYTAHARVAVYGGRPIPDYKSTVAHLERKVPEITQVMPFVQREAVLRSPTTVAGVLLRGIVGEDTAIINKNTIIAGTDLLSAKADTLPPIILSEGTARELNTSVGKALTAIRFFENIQSREQLLDNISRFRVVGIFRTGMTEYDNMQAFTTLEAAQDFVGFSAKQASGFNIMTHSLAEVPELTRNVQHTLKYPFYVESVFDIGQTIFAWIQLQKQPIPIILGLIIIVATFNIISTLLLIVIEKTHSIGVLKALGATNGGVAKIFIAEGLTIGLIGTALGNIIAFVLTYLEKTFHFFKLKSDIYFMSSVPVSIEWQHYAIVSGIALILALTATLIPARIAARMRPLQALRFG